MSKDKSDQNDEYEAMFEESDGSSAVSGKPDNNSSEVTSNVVDAEVLSSEGRESSPDRSYSGDDPSEAADTDIDDGIFAPERRLQKRSKSSGPMMMAVSLVAIVAVGGYVFISHPDMFGNIRGNLNSQPEIITPTEVQGDVISQQQVPSETVEMAPSDAPADVANDNATPPQEVSAQPPAPMATGDVNLPPSQTSSGDPLGPPPSVPDNVAAQVTPVGGGSAVVSMPSNVIPSNQESPPVQKSEEKLSSSTPSTNIPLESETQSAKDSPEVSSSKDMSSTSAEPSTVIPTVPAVTGGENVLLPSNSSSPTEAVDDSGSANKLAQANSVPVNPPAEVRTEEGKGIASDSTSAKDASKKDVNSEVPSEITVVEESPETKKLLDDTNLDKYFDSPGGKILKEIPAPSMNPYKGSRESLIIVNKGGTKKNTPSSQQKVSIETTQIDSKLLSADRAMRLGRYDAAMSMYEELYKLSPKDEKVLTGRALALQKSGSTDQAVSAYEELINQFPDNVGAAVNLAGLLRKQYPAEALGKLLDLHVSHPDNPGVTAQLGVAYADSGNNEDAMRYLKQAAAKQPKNPQHYFNIAIVAERMGNKNLAIGMYEKSLEIDAVYSEGAQGGVPREKIYDRLSQLRGN